MLGLNLLLEDVSLHVIFCWMILSVLVKIFYLYLFCIPVCKIEIRKFFRWCIISKSQDKFSHIFEFIFEVGFMIMSSTSEGAIYEALCAICYNLCNLKNVENTHGGLLLLVTLPHFSSFIPYLCRIFHYLISN